MALYGARAVDFPDTFKSAALSRFEPYPFLTTATAFSSHAPATFFFHPVLLAAPVQIANINFFKSLSVSAPQATSAASTGSEGYSYSHGFTLFTRQDSSANSTNLSQINTASVGLSVTVGYSSTSQVMGMSWVTDTTGGISSLSTTSNAANWSNSLSGLFRVAIPFQAVLSAGEYFFAHAHSSTAATSNSAVTLLSISNLHVAPQLTTFINLGGSASVTSAQIGIGLGVASALTTNASMAGSVISGGTVNFWVQEMSAL